MKPFDHLLLFHINFYVIQLQYASIFMEQNWFPLIDHVKDGPLFSFYIFQPQPKKKGGKKWRYKKHSHWYCLVPDCKNPSSQVWKEGQHAKSQYWASKTWGLISGKHKHLQEREVYNSDHTWIEPLFLHPHSLLSHSHPQLTPLPRQDTTHAHQSNQGTEWH